MATFYEIIVHMPDTCIYYEFNYTLYCFIDYPKVLQEELIVRLEKGWYELSLISQQEGFNTKVTKKFRNVEGLFEEIYPQKKLEVLEKKRIKIELEIEEAKKKLKQ